MAPFSLRRLGLIGDWLAERLEALGQDEQLAALLVRLFPKRRFGYQLLAKTYNKNDKPLPAIKLLLAAPREVQRAVSIVLLLEKAYRDADDHVSALAVLTSAQADHPSEPEILIRLSNLYKDDSQLERAYALLLSAESLGRDESARRLLIETAAKNVAAGCESMRRLMRRRGRGLLKAAPLVNQFAVRYPDLETEVAEFQTVVRDAVQSSAGVLSPSERLELALSSRMMDEARLVRDDAVRRGLPLLRRPKRFYKVFRKQAGSVSVLANLAWQNERGDGRRFAALAGGRPITIDRAACDPERTVEIFIPVAFDRPEYSPLTRQAFHILASRVAQRPHLIVVPRHQFNARAYRPLLHGRTLSYHTRGVGDRRHLRFKEAALPGYVTLDHCGYAGFASAATDFDQIRRAVANVPREFLCSNRATLYAELVEKGRSKYAQPALDAGINGRYVFVALQVITDEVAELAWISSIELLRQVVRLYSGTNIAVVVKRHPLCKSFSVQAAMSELESKGLIVASTASIHSLISKADVVFTANSGVGLEALIHGRPVVVSGLCDYAYAAWCIRNAEELEAAVTKVESESLKGLEFLYYYTHRHAFKVSERDRLEQRVDEWLDQPLELEPSPQEAGRQSNILGARGFEVV